MRWIKPAPPQLGDKRIVTQWLIVPQTIGNETRLWEKATWEEAYSRNIVGTEFWTPTKWISQ